MDWTKHLNGLVTSVNNLSTRQRAALALGLITASVFFFWDGNDSAQTAEHEDTQLHDVDEFISLFEDQDENDGAASPAASDGASSAEQILAEAELPPDDSMTPLMMNSDSHNGAISTAAGSGQSERPIRLTGTIYPIK